MTVAAWGSSVRHLQSSPSSVFADEVQPAEIQDTNAQSPHAEPSAEHADGGHGGGHTDPVAEVLLAILIILFLAKVVGDLFERLGMPAVLGELTVGIILGNWALFTGSDVFDFFKPHPGDVDNLTGTVLDMLARIGVVLLLFEVGLESRVKEMVSVGVSSLLVALLGVGVPMLLGFGVGYVLISESLADWQVPAFLGATLCATSVGITARVLKDLGRSRDRESKIILGAAVIDDVLGLVVLAVVSGLIVEGDQFQIMTLVKIVGLSVAFLAGALFLGAIQFPRMLFRGASFLRGHGLLVTTALMICFLFSWGASEMGLAPIIGAFAAGLILEGAHYQEVGEKWKNHRLEDALAPLSALLVPIFFVATGIAVDLSQFTGGSVWMLAIGLTVVAILGKLVCAYGVREPGLNRLAVGLGMIPRGEVGLIFAQVGQGLKTPDGADVVDKATFSAIVVMVMVTTMITPPLLKWALSRSPADSEKPVQPEPTYE
ncbi:MAG: cation:proton antiporter [Fuerstiella sp.]|nr:cation:proton antiporter [Fuerstiella sp.]MCP4858901.1 cation:proton antiporter [Fuerstiella sp.]